jgi:transposase-like protein
MSHPHRLTLLLPPQYSILQKHCPVVQHVRMKAYSEDLRKKIVEALRRGTSKSEAARLFGVSLSSVKRYAKMLNEGRTLAPKKNPGKRPKVDERGKRLLEADLDAPPAAALPERGE